ncbi:MAG: carbamoyltransferase [Vampirovibrionales bacterium]
MKILGISAFYHDSAAALIEDGLIVAAAQEERFTRKKHDPGFPSHAVRFCLDQAQCLLSDIDYIVFYDKPYLKFERLLETYLAFAPQGFTSFTKAMPIWIREKLFQKNMIIDALKELDADVDLKHKLLFTEHHQSHAASAFYPSPFDEAAILTLDGVGEWATTAMGTGRGHELTLHKEIHFPHSLGLLYSAFTYYTGFKVNSGEYKVMGLAPYGQPRYTQTILDTLLDVKADGSFRLNMDYFNYCTGLTMTNAKFDALFGGPARQPESRLTQREMDLAASVQEAIEYVVLKLARSLAQETGMENLCMAGGVALNCVANGKILKDGAFKRLWIQPAAGDAGGALGAALAAYHHYRKQPRPSLTTGQSLDHMQGAYLGIEYNQDEIERRLAQCGARFSVLPEPEIPETAANILLEGKAVGWFQGRMEFGPRALGARSILGDARSPQMQKDLNLKVKFRESFRPFAPSVLAEDAQTWFDWQGHDATSPYMLLVTNVHPDKQKPLPDNFDDLFGIDKLNTERSEVPAITHVDYSARVQTVHAQTNPKYHALLSAFKQKTGCPMVVNTSFNVRGEPIVCSPEDAFRCFMGTDIEALVIGNCVLKKDEQDPHLVRQYHDQFEKD